MARLDAPGVRFTPMASRHAMLDTLYYPKEETDERLEEEPWPTYLP